ncbi:MAG: HEAT repeat domain-containing protein [Gemmatimonadaceae bacterium]|nr:HEAT repeat domain-containing protein [Gemmatimonadaceae bacterium]
MASGITFARHFAILVSSFGFGRATVEEQKLNLRAAVAATKGGAVRLFVEHQTLYANDEPVSPIFSGVRELLVQLDGHGVAGIQAAEATAPADLLLLARSLAAPFGDGSRLERDLVAAAPPTIRVAFAIDQTVPLAPAEAPKPIISLDPEPTPAVGTAPLVVADAPPATDAPAVATPDAPLAAKPTPEPMPAVAADAATVFSALAGARTVREAIPELLASLHGETSAARLARTLDEISTFAEVAQREGRHDDTVMAYHGIVEREAAAEGVEQRRAFIVALRRLAKPAVLDAVVRQAVSVEPAMPTAVAILQRLGDDAVLAVATRAVSARTPDDRSRLEHLLRTLPNAATALGQIVATAKPAIGRAAARLAADIGAADAEAGLLQALEQAAVDVRRDALAALAVLATPRAAEAHTRALHDDEVVVRLQAAAGLALLRPAGAASTLGVALRDEADTEVQVALVQAIGRTAQPEALELLVHAAEPAKGVFRRKSLALRVAAVHALAQLRIPGVSAALQNLAQDKERAVRDALAQATRIQGRRTTRSMMAIPG